MANPRPGAEVQSVDLVSTKSKTTWVVLAMTTGPAGELRVGPGLENTDAPAEQIVMKLTAVNSGTGKTVPDMQFRVTLSSGRRPRLYGVFRADEKGESVVDLPPERLKLVAVETFCNGYGAEQTSWNLASGEKIPTNYTFSVSKEAP